MNERKKESKTKAPSNGWALLPIVVFLVLYLGNGIYFEYIHPIKGEMGFYIMSVVVAFGIALVVAFLQNRMLTFDEKIHICATGIGDDNITIMLCIFLLSGAFSGIAGSAGGVTSTANMLLNIIPANLMLLGLFIIACIISMAMGTSVGTITVLVPIAVQAAEGGGFSTALCVGTVVGGAMFGDNLSFISDTTIAATKTQGVEMTDKFKANIRLALPAAILTLIILLILSHGIAPTTIEHYDFNPVLAIPYFIVLIMALLGVNVFVVLLTGILLFFGAGLVFGSLDYVTAFTSMGTGTANMFETMIVAILVACISALMQAGGGFEALLNFIFARSHSKRGGMLGIFLLTAFLDVATANNTVAIIIAAPIAKEISTKYHVSGQTTASLMDTGSCIAQCMIPYGAQLLIAANLAGISSLDIITQLIYPVMLIIFSVISIARAK